MVAKSKLPVIIVLAIVLVAAVGLYSAYAFFDVFKSNKTIYLETEAKEMQNFSKVLDDYEKTFNEYAKPYLEGGMEQKMEISNVMLDMQPSDPQMAKILEVVKNAKIVSESKVDDKNNKNYAKIDVNIKNNNVIGAEFFYDNEKVGFGVPVIYNKYGYFNWKDKAVIEQKYGMTGIPERIPTTKEYIELFKLPREELEPIMAEYAKLYADSIQDKQVIVNKNVTFEEQGVKIDAKQITVTFTAEEYKQLMKKMADKISKDEKLQDLLYPRYEKLAELSASGASEDLPKLTKEEFKKKFADFKKDADRSIDEQNTKEGLKMIVLADKQDNILSRTIETENKESGKKAAMKLVSFEDNEGKSHVVFDVAGNDNENVNIAYVNKKEGDNNKGNVKFTFKESGSDVVMDAAFTTTKEGGKQTQDVKVNMKDNQDASFPPIALTWKGTTTDNDKDKTRKAEYKFELVGPQDDPSMPKKITFDVKSDEKFNLDTIKLPELNAQNSVNMATVTDEQMMQIQQEIQNGGMQFMMKNMALFQELGIIPPNAGMVP